MPSYSLAAAILAAVIAVAIPLTGPFERRIYGSDPKTPVKLLAYGANCILLWTLMAAAIWIDGWGQLVRSPAAGVAWLWLPRISSLVLSLATAAFMIAGMLPLIQSLRGPRWRRAYAAAIRRGFQDIPGLLPTTATERAAWIILSITAGLCEEVLFRGFLIRFLGESGFGLPLAAALIASSLIFGLGHAYQGFQGILRTAIAGLAYGLLFLLSGSLIACIVLHALMDLQMIYILRPFPPGDAVKPEAA